jgi:hypothetical protein
MSLPGNIWELIGVGAAIVMLAIAGGLGLLFVGMGLKRRNET